LVVWHVPVEQIAFYQGGADRGEQLACERGLPGATAPVDGNDKRAAATGLPSVLGVLSMSTTPTIPRDRDRLDHARYERTVLGGSGRAATWHTVFPGGCVTAQLDWTSAADAGFATEARSIIAFTTRQALQQALEQRSGGRLHLDPPPG
jgi:hypothetical protein